MKKKHTIVIADRGWVWVGIVSRRGDMTTIRDAQCIRRWGTTRGIGQIALDGPTDETVMDQCGTVVVPNRAVIAHIPCAW